MDDLKVTINPYNNTNSISLNGQPLSVYSRLNSCLGRPFLECADRFFHAADAEINDEYRLTVVAERLEQMFLCDRQKSFDLCVEFRTENFPCGASVDARLEEAECLAEKYGIPYSEEDYRIPVYTGTGQFLDGPFVKRTSSPEAACFCVTDDRKLLPRAAARDGPAILLLVCGRSGVSMVDGIYVWEARPEKVMEISGAVIDRFAKIPAILNLADQLNSVRERMDQRDRSRLSALTEINSVVHVADIPELQAGESYGLKISTLPARGTIPVIRAVSSNDEVVSVCGTTLKAEGKGQAFIDLYRDAEGVPFARKRVQVIQEYLVEKIQLYVREPKMKIGTSQGITVQAFPDDADDVHEIRWAVDDPLVAAVDKNGCITALQEGRTKVCAYTGKARSWMDIEVLPDISHIRISVGSSTKLYVGQTQDVSVEAEPENAFDRTVVWTTSDRQVAFVESLEDGRKRIRAAGVGECILACTAESGACSSECRVSVESTFNRKEYDHTFLSLTLAAMIISLFLAACTFGAGAGLACLTTLVFGVNAMLKNETDVFWAGILMLVSAVVVAGSFIL